MLKIICDVDENGKTFHQIETGGPMLDLLADLSYAIIAIYQNIKNVNEELADAFRLELACAMRDPKFWNYVTIGEGTTSICSIIPNKDE